MIETQAICNAELQSAHLQIQTDFKHQVTRLVAIFCQ